MKLLVFHPEYMACPNPKHLLKIYISTHCRVRHIVPSVKGSPA